MLNVALQDGTALALQPHPTHYFLMPTEEVAKGYGVAQRVIRDHKRNHADELREGTHWVVDKIVTLGGEQSATFWTRQGVIRLGFFIKSPQARQFRDWAEDYLLHGITAAMGTDTTPPPAHAQQILETVQRRLIDGTTWYVFSQLMVQLGSSNVRATQYLKQLPAGTYAKLPMRGHPDGLWFVTHEGAMLLIARRRKQPAVAAAPAAPGMSAGAAQLAVVDALVRLSARADLPEDTRAQLAQEFRTIYHHL